MKIRIEIEGILNEEWAEWFENFEIIHKSKSTILKGKVSDQSALHGVLNKIRDLNLKLVSVSSK